jgi:D-2-hydroxyacid dehydrogenase (NADP+)
VNQPVLHVLIDVPAGSTDARHFQTALARFDGRIAVTYADGDAFDSALAEAEVVVTGELTDDQLQRAPRLRWLSSVAAGLDGVATPAVLARGVAVTGASGVHGPNIAEHVMAMILMFTRGFPKLFRAQLAHRWQRDVRSRSDGPAELTGQTLLIVGLGRIGEALAARARAFGMRIVGVKRDPSRRHAEGTAVDEVMALAALDQALPHADHVCLALPLTPATRRLMDGRRLALMRSTAFLYNVSRGAIVDEAALIEALRAGKLAGAGLDVFEEEPLPATSPLWGLENVILTPHLAGVTPVYYQRAAALFADNLERFLAGRPLANRFEADRGY